jgi:AAHS family 4-hydroxybenzoate transporter-like MFS transporter
MTGPRLVNVTELVDRSRLGRFQLGTFAVLGASLVMDGFDVQAMGFVAPAIIREWGIANAEMGPVFGAGLLGLFLGSLAFGMLADRIGRRPVLIGATLAFGVFTILTARAGSMHGLMITRFLAGLGLGAIMPNATALVGEYTPGRRRVATMMIVTNGFLVGAVLGGFLAAWLIPAFGWRSVLWAGGVLPVAVVVPMLLWLPESLQFLVVRGKSVHRIERWLRQLAPGAVGRDARYFVAEERRPGLPLVALFRGGRAAGTVLLWAANFLNVLNVYFVASWLPTVVRDAGHPTSTAVLVGVAAQAGGLVGTVVLGLALQRVGFAPVLTTCFAVAAVGLAVIGRPDLPLATLFVVAVLVGWGLFAGQPGLNALAATYYPTDLRSTGIGAGLGIGRFGAILGPVIAGELMQRRWTNEELFQAAAIPALLASALVFALRWVVDPRRGASAPGALAR